ncbi:MAG TPA: chloride channel protein [Pseudobdellovibrionaceae bacterium]|nr:chloride channel protein [Pseudobdellovibrionaceae bacterium]
MFASLSHRALHALKLALAVSLTTLLFRAGLEAIVEARSHFVPAVIFALLATWPLLEILRRSSPTSSWWDGVRHVTDPWLGHLAGASIGREGVGLKIGEWLAQRFSLPSSTSPNSSQADDVLRMDLHALCWAAGFTAIFHTPWAAIVWVISELRPKSQSMRQLIRHTLWAMFGSLTAWLLAEAFGFHLHVWGLGSPHTWQIRGVAQLLWHLSWLVPILVLTSLAYHLAKNFFARRVQSKFLIRSTWGMVAIIVAVWLNQGGSPGVMSLGLELFPTFSSDSNAWSVVALKLLLTAMFVGGGLRGGEVTPLLMCGAALGGAVAGPTGASLGFASLWGTVSQRGWAAMILAWEILGLGAWSMLTVLAGVFLSATILEALLAPSLAERANPL